MNRIITVVIITCFAACDIARAYPAGMRAGSGSLVQQTLFTSPDKAGSLARAAAKYLEASMAKAFAGIPLADVQATLEYIRETAFSSLRIDGRRFNVTGGAEEGQVFVTISESCVLRYFNPKMPALPLPADNLTVSWEYPINEYLGFQLLKTKPAGSTQPVESSALEAGQEDMFRRLGMNSEVFLHEIVNIQYVFSTVLEIGELRLERDGEGTTPKFAGLLELNQQMKVTINGLKELSRLFVSGRLTKEYLNQTQGCREWRGKDLTEYFFEEVEKLHDMLECVKNYHLNRYVPVFSQEHKASIKIASQLMPFACSKIAAFFRSKGGLDAIGRQQEMDVNSVIEMAAVSFFRKDKNIILSLNDVPPVMGDKLLFMEVLYNLIKNGFEAADKEGFVRVGTFLDSQSNEVVVTVEDNGRGIAPQDKDRIYEMFFTTKGELGTGVGVAFSKEIVENAGGTITFDSEYGKGTTFTIRLPASAGIDTTGNPGGILGYFKALDKQGDNAVIAGVNLADLENESDLTAYLNDYCVVQEKEVLKDLLQNRLKGGERALFDSVFNPRARLAERVKGEGRPPLKVVHVRGGRGAAKVTEELSALAREGFVDLTIIPGAVDDGRSWADMAYYLNTTGVPDMGKGYSDMGSDTDAVGFAVSRLVEGDTPCSKQEAFELLGEAIRGFKNKYHKAANADVRRLVRQFEVLDREKRERVLPCIIEFYERIKLEQRKNNLYMDIRRIPMRSVIIVGAREIFGSWQGAIDFFGEFVDSAGRVLLPTEDRLYAMALLEDGTFLPTENALNEAGKDSGYLYFTVGPGSFASKEVFEEIFYASMGRPPQEREKRIIELLRMSEYDRLKGESINLLRNMSKPEIKNFIGFIEKTFSYLSSGIMIQPSAAEAVSEADMIIYGPTDIESNIASAVIYDDIREAIERNRSAVKILIGNSRDEHHIEPPGTTISSQMERLYRYLSDQQRYRVDECDWGRLTDFVTHVIGRKYDDPELRDYIPFDADLLRKTGVAPVGLDLEMLNLGQDRTGAYGAEYRQTRDGRYNSSLMVDVMLSLSMMNELGYPLELSEEKKTVDPLSNRSAGRTVMAGVEKTVPRLVNALVTASRRVSPARARAMVQAGDAETASEKEERRIGIFIDERLGSGKTEEIMEVLEKLTHREGLLGRLLRNAAIKYGDINDIREGPAYLETRKNVRKEDMVIITRNEELECLRPYEGSSVITKVDDADLGSDSYYPILEIILFSLARASILEYRKDDLIGFYGSIPNVERLDADAIVDLCWDENMNRCKSTIILKLGIPDAGQITGESELYKSIAEYLARNA